MSCRLSLDHWVLCQKGEMNAQFYSVTDIYDQSRPRYPLQLFESLIQQLSSDVIVLSYRAETGIVLESIILLLGDGTEVSAVDIFAGMIRLGKKEFPQVEWHLAEAEVFLHVY